MNRAIVIVKAGREDFADAMARGIMAARAGRERDDRLTEAQARVVSAEMDRQKIARLLHVAVGNGKTAEDYAAMRFRAEMQYGEPLYDITPAGRFARRALGLYGLLIMTIRAAYRAQDKVLKSS